MVKSVSSQTAEFFVHQFLEKEGLDFFGADKQPSNKEIDFCFYVVGHAQKNHEI